jgi:hypothetical protein
LPAGSAARVTLTRFANTGGVELDRRRDLPVLAERCHRCGRNSHDRPSTVFDQALRIPGLLY